MNKIVFRTWNYTCGEPGCCDEVRVDVYINGKQLDTDMYDMRVDYLREILDALGVEYEIVEE